jgi:hypothetical protein
LNGKPEQPDRQKIICQCGHVLFVPSFNEEYYKGRIRDLEKQLITKEEQISSLVDSVRSVQMLGKRQYAQKNSRRDNERKTKYEKTAAIAKYLEAKPTAPSNEIGKDLGIDPSDVRRLWKPIKKAMKEGKSALPSGYKNNGSSEAIDESASCKYCRDPLSSSFECEICKDIIVGECKTCHFTQLHPEYAVP